MRAIGPGVPGYDMPLSPRHDAYAQVSKSDRFSNKTNKKKNTLSDKSQTPQVKLELAFI